MAEETGGGDAGGNHVDTFLFADRILVPKQAREWDVQPFMPAGRIDQ
jgi:hypothetical protein